MDKQGGHRTKIRSGVNIVRREKEGRKDKGDRGDEGTGGYREDKKVKGNKGDIKNKGIEDKGDKGFRDKGVLGDKRVSEDKGVRQY